MKAPGVAERIRQHLAEMTAERERRGPERDDGDQGENAVDVESTGVGHPVEHGGGHGEGGGEDAQDRAEDDDPGEIDAGPVLGLDEVLDPQWVGLRG